MTQQRKRIIGVMGASECDASVARQAYEVGRLIAQRGAILLCGGMGGVMEAAARGAKEAGGLTVGILPGSTAVESPVNAFIDIAIFTGLGEGRNIINVKSSEVIIAVSGGYGTLSEIALALRVGKPVVLLHSWTFAAPSSVSPPARLGRAETAEEAVRLAFEFLTPQGATV